MQKITEDIRNQYLNEAGSYTSRVGEVELALCEKRKDFKLTKKDGTPLSLPELEKKLGIVHTPYSEAERESFIIETLEKLNLKLSEVKHLKGIYIDNIRELESSIYSKLDDIELNCGLTTPEFVAHIPCPDYRERLIIEQLEAVSWKLSEVKTQNKNLIKKIRALVDSFSSILNHIELRVCVTAYQAGELYEHVWGGSPSLDKRMKELSNRINELYSKI